MWTQRKLAVLGASRGLGAAVVRLAQNHIPDGQILLSSRKIDLLRPLARINDPVVAADFTESSGQNLLLEQLESFRPTDIIYVSGGGPYGEFAKKQVKDHLWALDINLIFPMKLLHFLLNSKSITGNIKNIVFVGSAVAESLPDALASSYAAGKHGLKGLISSIQSESPDLPLKLFSPGYMDTDMLPKNAKVRIAEIVSSPQEEAKKLWKLL